MKAIKDNKAPFRNTTPKEREAYLRNLKRDLSKLQNGFADIYTREKYIRFEKFEKTFSYLIRKVRHAQNKREWRKTYFNLFATLGYQRLEDTHSNILAWLLNPQESHGLGDGFLRAFVKRVFNSEPPLHLEVSVTREKQKGGDRPDIVVESDNWWLIIENKIDSEEQKRQTLRYVDCFRTKGTIGKNVFFAFLSPSGWTPESHDFCPVSYQVIRELLQHMHFQGDSSLLIRHFIDHIFLDLEE